MQRKKIIFGNWKMNLNLQSSVALVNELKRFVMDNPEITENIDVGICPPFVYLLDINDLIVDIPIYLGAQNMYYEPKGAFTGEISPAMLRDVGCSYVILGHSERRHIFKETNALINQKIKIAIEHNLRPIFCIGELLEEREKGATQHVIEQQLIEGLRDISNTMLETITIAYEPVWAIGTGKTATPEQAQEIHVFVREVIKNLYSEDASRNIKIQYGGSVNPENIASLIKQPDIDGALVGGASLKVESFCEILRNAL